MAIVQKVNIVKFFNRNEVSAHLVIKFESKGCRQIVADLNRFNYGFLELEESYHVSISRGHRYMVYLGDPLVETRIEAHCVGAVHDFSRFIVKLALSNYGILWRSIIEYAAICL